MKLGRNILVLLLVALLSFTATACASRMEAPGTPSPSLEETTPLVPLAASPNPSTPTVEETPHGRLAMGHLAFMNEQMNRRTSFTYREVRAANWIAQTLVEMGHPQENVTLQRFASAIEPIWQEWLDEIEFFGDLEQLNFSQNVILTVPGQSEQTIVIGAHYDTFRDYIGASDNASGVALLLESAQRMRQINNYYTLVYVFFGAEEVNLAGARHFFNSLTTAEQRNILFMFNADVLLEGPYLIYITGVYENGRRGENSVTRAWDTLARQLNTPQSLELINLTDVTGIWFSDHEVFYEAGIPVIFLTGMSRAPDGEFVGDIAHTTQDDLRYINRRWPGMAEQNMRAFSLFMEAVLLHQYQAGAASPLQ